jgi:hypothetical protein
MNVGDKIVCIKPYFLEDYEYAGYKSIGIDIKVGDKYNIISIAEYRGEGLIKYDDVKIFLVSDGKTKMSFYSREVSYRYCIHDHFTLLAPFRDKRIDEILND